LHLLGFVNNLAFQTILQPVTKELTCSKYLAFWSYRVWSQTRKCKN